MPPAGGGSPYRRKKLYRRIRNRLRSQAEFSAVRFRPSRIRPRQVLAAVDPSGFVGPSYPAEAARIEIEFDLREPRNHYRIQWVEPARGLACGFHQDGTHPEFGECHFQVDHPDGTVEREPAAFLDAHPLAAFERRMAVLPGKLDGLAVRE